MLPSKISQNTWKKVTQTQRQHFIEALSGSNMPLKQRHSKAEILTKDTKMG